MYCMDAITRTVQRGEPMNREEAMNVLKANYPDPCFSDLRKAVDMAIKALEQPEPKWISCSERLPEVHKWVLCQCRAGICDVLCLSEEREWNNSFATYMCSFVLAWMPLPEPYREEGD